MFKDPVVSDGKSFYVGDKVDVNSIKLSSDRLNRLTIKDNELFVKNSNTNIISSGSLFYVNPRYSFRTDRIRIPLLDDDVRIREEVLYNMGYVTDNISDKDRIKDRIYFKATLYLLADDKSAVNRTHICPTIIGYRKVGEGKDPQLRGRFFDGFPVDDSYTKVPKTGENQSHGKKELHTIPQLVNKNYKLIFTDTYGVEREFYVVDKTTYRRPVTMYSSSHFNKDGKNVFTKKTLPDEPSPYEERLVLDGSFPLMLFGGTLYDEKMWSYTYIEYDVIYVPN